VNNQQVKMTAFHNTRQKVISRELATEWTPVCLYMSMLPGSSHGDDDDKDKSDHCRWPSDSGGLLVV